MSADLPSYDPVRGASLHEPAPLCLGYVSSGRMKADMKRDEAIAERAMAHRCFRSHLILEGQMHLRRAMRAWKNYRFFTAKIKENRHA